MPGINEIIKEINQKGKVNNQEVVKKVLHTFIKIVKQKLNKGENIDFKGNFSLKRSITLSEESKNCAKHQKSIASHKKANKNKGIVAFSGSVKFRKLVQEIKVCKDCKKRKKESLKSAKLNKRVIFEPRSLFWITTKTTKNKKRRR